MFEQAWTFVTLSYIIRRQIPTKIGESLPFTCDIYVPMYISDNLDKFHVISNTGLSEPEGAIPPPGFEKSVNPILTGGTDYVRHRPPRDF